MNINGQQAINQLVQCMAKFVEFLFSTNLVAGVSIGAFILVVLVLNVVAKSLWR